MIFPLSSPGLIDQAVHTLPRHEVLWLEPPSSLDPMAATQAEPPVPEASGPVDPGASADMEHGGPPPPQSLQNGEKNNKPPSGPPTPGGPPPGPDMNVGPKGKLGWKWDDCWEFL